MGPHPSLLHRWILQEELLFVCLFFYVSPLVNPPGSIGHFHAHGHIQSSG